jgi:hypothetical protein
VVYVRSIAALWLLIVWSVLAVYAVLAGQDTALAQISCVPVMGLVGLLLGLDLKKVLKNDE